VKKIFFLFLKNFTRKQKIKKNKNFKTFFFQKKVKKIKIFLFVFEKTAE